MFSFKYCILLLNNILFYISNDWKCFGIKSSVWLHSELHKINQDYEKYEECDEERNGEEVHEKIYLNYQTQKKKSVVDF